MVTAYKELYIAEILIMVMIVQATAGSVQVKIEQSIEYKVVDEEPGEQDISALPA